MTPDITPEEYVERYGKFYERAIVQTDEEGMYCVYLIDETWGQDDDPGIRVTKDRWGRFRDPGDAERLAAKLSAGIRRAREKS